MNNLTNIKQRVLMISLITLQIYASDYVRAETPNLGEYVIKVIKPISSEKILPGMSYIPGEVSTTIEVKAAPGEYEPASFLILLPQGSDTNINIVASNLESSSSLIAASNIDLRTVKPWYQSYYAWHEIGKANPTDFRQILVPELLLHDDSLVKVDTTTQTNSVKLTQDDGSISYIVVNPASLAATEQQLPSVASFPIKDEAAFKGFDLKAGEIKQVWVTVHIPPNASSGSYEGGLQVRVGSNTVGTINLRVTVLPFQLASPKMTYSIYYRAQLDDVTPTVGSERRNEGQMRSEFENMRDHGISSPTILQLIDRSGSHIANINRVIRLRNQAGFDTEAIYSLGLNMKESLVTVNQIAPGLITAFKSEGYSDIYLYGIDEARGDMLVSQRDKWNSIHAMGGKIVAAGQTGAFELMGDLLDVFIHAFKPDPAEASKFHSVGHRIFNYANPQSGPEDPLLWRINYGIVLWAAGYDGAMPYAYQHCFGSCWSDIDHATYRDHALTYPTANGVIDTIAWEGYREAIDDVRYITTLEQKIDQNIGSTILNMKTLAIESKGFLDNLRVNTLNSQRVAGKYNIGITLDPDSTRDEIIRRILQFDSVLPAPSINLKP